MEYYRREQNNRGEVKTDIGSGIQLAAPSGMKLHEKRVFKYPTCDGCPVVTYVRIK